MAISESETFNEDFQKWLWWARFTALVTFLKLKYPVNTIHNQIHTQHDNNTVKKKKIWLLFLINPPV